jgi:hypothetical protein
MAQRGAVRRGNRAGGERKKIGCREDTADPVPTPRLSGSVLPAKVQGVDSSVVDDTSGREEIDALRGIIGPAVNRRRRDACSLVANVHCNIHAVQ